MKKSGLIAVCAFIPTCTGINLTVDAYSFGEHHYSSANDVGFQIVSANIPRESKNIELHLTKGAFAAKFQITETDLNEWFNNVWKEKGERAAFEMKKTAVVVFQLPSHLASYGWNLPGEYIEYEGPIFKNGSGSQLFFDKQNNIAYQFYAFW